MNRLDVFYFLLLLLLIQNLSFAAATSVNAASSNTIPVSSSGTTAYVISSSKNLTADVTDCSTYTINSGVTLTTSGYSIICTGNFINQGTLVGGRSSRIGNSFPSSYGGSGGGGGGGSGIPNKGGDGFDTLAAGGAGGASSVSPGLPGSSPSVPSLSNSVIAGWYAGTMYNYLSGARGGHGNGATGGTGGSGSFGIYIQAANIILGSIVVTGDRGDAGRFSLDTGNAGGGGGGGGGQVVFSCIANCEFFTTTVGSGGLGGNGGGGGNGGNGGASASDGSLSLNGIISYFYSPSIFITLTANQVNFYVNNQISLQTTLVNGTQPFTYNYTIINSGSTVTNNALYTGCTLTTNTFITTITSTGTYTTNIVLTDTALNPQITQNTPYISLNVVNIPTAAAPSPSNTLLDSGQWEVYTESTSAGFASFNAELFNVTGNSQQGSNALITTVGGSNTVKFRVSSPTQGNTFTYNFLVTDLGASNPYLFNSTKSTITVNAMPILSSFTVTNSVVDVGQTTAYTATLSSGTGTGPFTVNFVYGINGVVAQSTAGVAIGTATVFNFKPGVANTYAINAIITDTGATTPYIFNSVQATVTANPLPTPSISASNTFLDSGQMETMTLSTTGGTGPFQAELFNATGNKQQGSNVILPAGAATNTINFVTSSPTQGNAFTFNNFVTDTGVPTNVFANSISTTITVNAVPTVASFTQSNSIMDLGQTDLLTITLTAAKGTGPFTIKWEKSDGTVLNTAAGVAIGGTATFAYVPGTTGTYVINAVVTDTGTTTSYIFNSLQLTLVVNSLPAITLTPTNTLLDSGQSDTYTMTVSGGTGPFTINIINSTGGGNIRQGTGNFLITTIGGSNAFTLVTASQTQGNSFKFNAIVTDYGTTTNAFGTNSVVNTIIVNSLPSVTLSAPTNTILDSGQWETYTVTESAGKGTGPFTVQLTNVTGGIVQNANVLITTIGGSNTFTFKASSATQGNSFKYNAIITDYGTTTNAFGTNAVANTINVNSVPSITISPSNAQIGNGQSETYTLTVSGGTGPFNVMLYNVTGAKQQESNVIVQLPGGSNTISFITASLGLFKYNGIATDTGTSSPYVFNSAANTINVIFQSPTVSNFIPMNVILDSGQTAVYTVNVVGGIGPFNVMLYNVTGAKQQGSNVIISLPGFGNTIAFTAGSTGKFSYNVIITDVGYSSVFNSITNSIFVDPKPATNLIASTGMALLVNSIVYGNSIVMQATTSGGSGFGNFIYAWTVNGLSASNTTNSNTFISQFTNTLPAAANYTFNVIVTDNGVTTPDRYTVTNTVMIIKNASLSQSTWSGGGTYQYFQIATVTFNGIRAIKNQSIWSIYLNGQLVQSNTSTNYSFSEQGKPGTYRFQAKNAGNNNYTNYTLNTTLVVLNPSTGGSTGNINTTTISPTTILGTTTATTTIPTTVNSTSTTSISTTTTISSIIPSIITINIPSHKSQINVFFTRMARINFQNARSSLYVTSNSTGPTLANVTITNITDATTQIPDKLSKVTVLNVSVLSQPNISLNVTAGYPCEIPAATVAPYIFKNNAWKKLPFTQNSTSCTLTFNIPKDPTIGIFTSFHYNAPGRNITSSGINIYDVINYIVAGGFAVLLIFTIAYYVVLESISQKEKRKKKKKGDEENGELSKDHDVFIEAQEEK